MTLQITFRREIKNNETNYPSTIYFDSNTQTVVDNSDINDSFENSYLTILSRVQKWPDDDSSWLIKSANYGYINICVCNLLV